MGGNRQDAKSAKGGMRFQVEGFRFQGKRLRSTAVVAAGVAQVGSRQGNSCEPIFAAICQFPSAYFPLGALGVLAVFPAPDRGMKKARTLKSALFVF
jgi:hypothetical protein